MFRFTLLGAAAVLAIHAPAFAQQAPADAAQLAARIDAGIASYYKAGEPGASVIVTRDGKTLFRKGYGMADIEGGAAMDPALMLRIGSMTKQFTAVAILMLAEQGKLKLDDDIAVHLPGYPTRGEKITIEHLLTHTSGIASYTASPTFAANRHLDISVPDLIASFRDQPLDFKPGARWAYNNSGYILLGAIIEKLSGMPYAGFIQQRILDPLGMRNTGYENAQKGVLPRAKGYAQGDGKIVPSTPVATNKTYAAGALVSTVDDLARWDAAISAGKLLSAESWKRAFTAYKLADGRSANYGYGWEIGKVQGVDMAAHGGAVNGFSTYAIRIPAERVYVAVLSNAEYGVVQPDVVATKAAAIAIGKPLPDFRTVAVAPEALEAYTGIYVGEDKAVRTVRVEKGQLTLQRAGRPKMPLLPHAPDAFYLDKSLTHFAFVRDAQNKVAKLTIFQDGLQHDYPRTGDLPLPPKVIVLAPALLDTYLGSYQMAPGFVLEVKRNGEQLIGQATGQPGLDLLATAEGAFVVKQIDATVRFVKGADGTVTNLVWNQGGRERAAPRAK
ncbi:MAG TPA: serine hydrolase [Burkholderiaceae bacterium]